MRLEPQALEGFFDDMFGTPAATPAAPAATSPAPVKTPSVLETLTSTVQNVLPGLAQTVLAVKQQNQLNKINVARANAGMPPLDIAQYQEASAPVIKVQGGVDSGTSSRLAWGIGGGLLLLGLILTNRKGAK